MLYNADGTCSTTTHYERCVIANGCLYLTINGDTSLPYTPRLRLGEEGLQTAEGKPMYKEEDCK